MWLKGLQCAVEGLNAGRGILDGGRWPVGFRVDKMRRGKGDEDIDSVIEKWMRSVDVGRVNGREDARRDDIEG
jgi:hypothetical protein